MRKIQFIAWYFLAVLPLDSAMAQSLQDYRCTIHRVASAEPPPNNSHDFHQKNYINREFTVERRTGVMAGTLKNAYVTSPQVIDLGSKDNSFKVVTTMRKEEGIGAGSNVYVLTINEHVTSSKKPFIFVDNDIAYFGTCTHF